MSGDGRAGRRIELTRVRWYVASCKDGDAHLAESLVDGLVMPMCGRAPFRPFTSLPRPADPEQGCPGCTIAKARSMSCRQRVKTGPRCIGERLVSDR